MGKQPWPTDKIAELIETRSDDKWLDGVIASCCKVFEYFTFKTATF